MTGFRSGLTFWVRGWAFILNHRGLLALALAPLLLSALAVAGLVYVVIAHLGPWVNMALLGLGFYAEGWLHDFTFYSLFGLTLVLVAIVSLYALLWLHLLFTAPFYSLMADRALALAGRRPVRQVSTARMIWAGLLKTVLLAFASLTLFLFSFFPGVGVVVLVAGLFILAFDLIDYAFEAAGFTLRERLAYVAIERAQWAGMAAGLALTLLVPGLTLLVAPGAVVGGALILNLQAREEANGSRTPAS